MHGQWWMATGSTDFKCNSIKVKYPMKLLEDWGDKLLVRKARRVENFEQTEGE